MKSFKEFINENKDYHVHWKDSHNQGEMVIKASDPKDAETKAKTQLNKSIPRPNLKIVNVGLEASLYKEKDKPTAKEWENEMKRRENADNRYHSSGRYAADLKYLGTLKK